MLSFHNLDIEIFTIILLSCLFKETVVQPDSFTFLKVINPPSFPPVPSWTLYICQMA